MMASDRHLADIGRAAERRPPVAAARDGGGRWGLRDCPERGAR